MIRRPKASQREVRRAGIIPARAGRHNHQHTAKLVGVNRPVVAKWESCFVKSGLPGLAEARRSGRQPAVAAQTNTGWIAWHGTSRQPHHHG